MQKITLTTYLKFIIFFSIAFSLSSFVFKSVTFINFLISCQRFMLQIILQLPSFHTKWRLLCLLFLNIFQHAGKLFMNSLLLMVWKVYFSVSSEMILWTKDKHCKLTELNLGNNEISEQGVSDLCAALKDEHCELTKLELSLNWISDKGVSDLCSPLKDQHCELR